MHCGKKIIGILSSKTLREPKTVVFPQLEAIHKLSNGFRLLWLFPVDISLVHQVSGQLTVLYP